MADIFFIASDERALDLVESLRVQSPRSITFETDLASAVRRLHKENPLFVFIQSSMDGISCEEIATQARMLVDNGAVRLILLEDDGSPPGFAPPGFDASLRLTRSTAQLTSAALELLSEQDFAQPAATPAPLILDDLPDFDIPNFDATFEPHPAPQWPSEPSEPLVFDADALKDTPEEKAPEIAGSDEIVFFVAEPPPRKAPLQAGPAPAELPARQAAAQEGPQSKEKDRGAPRKSPYPSPDQIYRKAPELCGEPEEGDGQAAVEAPPLNRLARPVFLAGILLLLACGLVWRFTSHRPGPPVARETSPAPAAGETADQAGKAAGGTAEQQPLPAFIPKVPVDAAYAAAHPGWERYTGETLQFRVFREGGRIMAIQALAAGDAEIGERQVEAWFREAAGAGMPGTGKVKEADGVKVETRKARGGAEIAIYRNAERRILGVVLQLASPQQDKTGRPR